MDDELQWSSAASRKVVITPAPAFGSSVYRSEPSSGAQPASTDNSESQALDISGCHATTAQGRTQVEVPVAASSNMAPPSQPPIPASSLLDISIRCANEQRLEELYQLYLRRNHVLPGPGAHEVTEAAGLKPKASHRRPHNPAMDGPFMVAPGDSSTRVKEIAKSLEAPGSGVDFCMYNAPQSKDWCMRSIQKGGKIGTGQRGEGRCARHHALSTSEALTRGQTWVDTSVYGPIAVRKLGAHSEEGELSLWEQAALNMPRYAVGQALCTRVAKAGQPPVPGSHAQWGADAAPNSTGALPGELSSTEGCHVAPTLSKTEASAVALPVKGAQTAGMLPTSRAQAVNLFVPQKPPPAAVLRSAVRHSARPGDWEWQAVSRSLCNTFTMQDGGAFRNDRAKADVPRKGRAQGSLSIAHVLAQAGAAGVTGERQRDLDRGAASIPAGGACAEATARLMDPDSERRRAAARHAAQGVQTVCVRQQRWEMQSALLPLLKREAMQLESA